MLGIIWRFPTVNRTSRHALNPTTSRLSSRSPKGPYKVVAVGLYEDQANALDLAADVLQRAGFNQASRSFLVQALVRRLKNEIEGLPAEEIATLLLDRYIRRPLAPAMPRPSSPPPDNQLPQQGRTTGRPTPRRPRGRRGG